MSLIPTPYPLDFGIIAFPPALTASAVVPYSTFPPITNAALPGGEPIRTAELVFGPPAAGSAWLVDSVSIASSSSSCPDCHVGVIASAQPSLFVPTPNVLPYGVVDWQHVIASTGNGWEDVASFAAPALVHDNEQLAVLWVGVTRVDDGLKDAIVGRMSAFVWARVAYRVARVQ